MIEKMNREANIKRQNKSRIVDRVVFAGLVCIVWSIIMIHNTILLKDDDTNKTAKQQEEWLLREPITANQDSVEFEIHRQIQSYDVGNSNNGSGGRFHGDDGDGTHISLGQTIENETFPIASISLESISPPRVINPNDGNDDNSNGSIANPNAKEEDYEIIHTITTRFHMKQGSGKAPTLGMARLKLFEAFCLPTLIGQTNQNYFWIILTDPHLDKVLLDKITDLLDPMGNAYVTLTNEWINNNHGVNIIEYHHQLKSNQMNNSANNTGIKIVTGDIEKLKTSLSVISSSPSSKTSVSRKKVLLIDTLLDADDGFHRFAVDGIQKESLQHALALDEVRIKEGYLERNQKKKNSQNQTTHWTLKNSWWISAVSSHYEWHNRDIFLLKNVSDAKSQISSGIIGFRDDSNKMAISAGLTRSGILEPLDTIGFAYHPEWFPKQALIRHDRIGSIPRCGNLTTATDSMAETASQTGLHGCQKRILSSLTSIIKARTITSNSMDDVRYKQNSSDYSAHPNRQKAENELIIVTTGSQGTRDKNATLPLVWDQIQKDFNVSRSNVWDISLWLFDHAPFIAKDQLNAKWYVGSVTTKIFTCALSPPTAVQ